MNTLENSKNFFDKENSTDSKITNEEIGKRKILKAIFGKGFVQDEDLWEAGFELNLLDLVGLCYLIAKKIKLKK